MLARNPSRAHLRVLRECVEVERLASQLDDLATTVSALNAFHRQLVRLSQNHALNLLAGILEIFPAKAYAQLLESGSRAAINAFRDRTARSVRAHAELVELIAAGEETKAENFWRQYQIDTADYLERAGLAKLRVRLPDAES
jgi:DNA-binding FadR family transcriptional regulator